MSVSILFFKGEKFNSQKSEAFFEYPLSFQEAFEDTWEKAIVECGTKLLTPCSQFGMDDLPELLRELENMFNWTLENKDGNTAYVQSRIRELKALFVGFELGLESRNLSEYWFDIG